MTRDEILQMPAGREMDALVAEKVFGIKWDESRCRICGWPVFDKSEYGCTVDSCSMRPLPKRRADEHSNFSTDITAAWMVVEKLRHSANPEVEVFYMNCQPGRVFAKFGMIDDEYTEAPTAPLAICRAALLSVMEDTK